MSQATTTRAQPQRNDGSRSKWAGAAGTFTVLRFYLRRDRLMLPLWMLLTLGALLGGAGIVEENHPTVAAQQQRFEQLQELPMFLLFQGKAFAASLEALAVQQAFAGTTLIAAIGAALLVIRNTRSEEQSGRRELLGSLAIGWSAPLIAAVSLVLAGGLLTGVLATLGMIGLGFPAAGSMVLGAVAAGAAWVGVALAALCAQLTTNARLAGAAAVVAIMSLHYLRGIGHVAGDASSWLTWLSPSGWLEGTQAYAGNRVGPLLLVVAFVAIVLALAFRLSASRDVGAGLIPARPGNLHAPRSLRGIAGLAWRQNRTAFVIWVGFMALIGIAFGGAGSAAVTDYADAEWLADYAASIGVADPAQAFFVYVIFTMVFPIAAYAILTALRARSEETGGIAEMALAKPVDRLRWASGPIISAMVGSAGLLAILGTCLAVASPDVDGVLPLTLSLIPAVWVIVAVTVVAFGYLPRATTAIAWTFLAIGLVGEILVKTGLPDAVFLATSPIAHVNPYYTQPYSPYVLLVVAALLLGLGLAGLRRRDLPR